MEANKPVYFFGIGAQKAGTTWLHEVLNSYPDCALPPVKELHFFDIKYITDKSTRMTSMYRRRLEQMVGMANGFERDVYSYWEKVGIRTPDAGGDKGVYKDKYLCDVRVKNRLNNVIQLADYLKIQNSKDYSDYLESVRINKGANVVGEFTPSYSFLPEAAFREMDKLFSGSKFIFIMRDPVDRFFSQIRFRNKLAKTKRRAILSPQESFENAIRDPRYMQRSDYKTTIQTLEAVISKDRIEYIFFEEMLSPDTVVRTLRGIERLLGLTPKEENELLAYIDVKKNATERTEFSMDNKNEVRNMLSDVYDYVEQRFGYFPRGWS